MVAVMSVQFGEFTKIWDVSFMNERVFLTYDGWWEFGGRHPYLFFSGEESKWESLGP